MCRAPDRRDNEDRREVEARAANTNEDRREGAARARMLLLDGKGEVAAAAR